MNAIIFSVFITSASAQTGCTDYQATNYDPAATINDGSCMYPLTTMPLIFKCRIDSIELNETSGIANQDKNFWTHVDDSNNSIYKIDSLSDSIFQKVTLNNSSNYDWEDITADSDYIYVGDVGNNDGNRTNLRFYKVRQSDITPTSTNVDAGRINFSYSDQVDFTVNHNHNFYDCEAFFVMNDSIHMFTKGWVNRWTKHYVLPADTGTHVAQLVDSFNVVGLITSAAIQGDTLVVLLGLNFNSGSNCFVWMLSDFQGSNFFSGNKRRFYLGNPFSIGQMEAICFTDTNKGYITNEKIGNVAAQIREFNLNPYLAPPPPAPVITPSVFNLEVSARACNDSGSVTFAVINSTPANGLDLNLTVGLLPPHVSVSPVNSLIAPGDSTIFTVDYQSGSFSSGDYVSGIYLYSNDPVNPTQIVMFKMFVDSNPCMDYTFISDTCTGITSFNSTSINTPTYYHWDFGDGDTSDLADPVHNYAMNGYYVARLIACNSAGCDTVEQNILASLKGPKAISCHPSTQAYCCGRGITYFRLNNSGGDAIFKISSDAINSYEDYTCSDSGYMITSNPYTLTCITGTSDPEYLKVWLDLNNDGMLDSISEELYSSYDTVPPVHTGELIIPALPSNVYGIPLRMRVASDYQQIPGPCLNPVSGQHEDYSVIVNFSLANEDISERNGFTIYPNPFSQKTTISYFANHSSEVVLNVYDIAGRKVESLIPKTEQTGNYKYEIGGYLPGIYFLRISVNKKFFEKKFVVIK